MWEARHFKGEEKPWTPLKISDGAATSIKIQDKA